MEQIINHKLPINKKILYLSLKILFLFLEILNIKEINKKTSDKENAEGNKNIPIKKFNLPKLFLILYFS